MSPASQAPHGDLGPVLTVRDLEVTYPTARGSLRAVGGISYSIDPGRTLGVVGESGCGKSVSALAVLGLVPPPGQVTLCSSWPGPAPATAASAGMVSRQAPVALVQRGWNGHPEGGDVGLGTSPVVAVPNRRLPPPGTGMASISARE